MAGCRRGQEGFGWTSETAQGGVDVELAGSAGCLSPVPLDVLGRGLGGVAGAEVGVVAVEHVDPLGACLVEGVGDEVGGVVVAAAGVMPTYAAAGGSGPARARGACRRPGRSVARCA